MLHILLYYNICYSYSILFIAKDLKISNPSMYNSLNKLYIYIVHHKKEWGHNILIGRSAFIFSYFANALLLMQ